MFKTVSAAAFASLGVVLSGCGGGGGGGGGASSVALQTKGDALRELGNSVNVIGELTGLQVGPGTVSSPLSAKAASIAKSQAAAPRAAQVETCDSGTVSHDDVNGGTHVFSLFSSTPQTVSSTHLVYSTCQHTDTTSTPNARYTINGVSEVGSSEITSDGSMFVYTQHGQGNTAIDYRYEELSGTQTSYWELNRYLGTIEVKVETDDQTSARALYSNSYSNSTGYQAEIRYGDGSSALQIDHNATGDQLSINGRYTYSSSSCSGGAVDVTTPTTVSLDQSGHPIGGVLQINTATQTATLSFQSDGSATLLLNGVTQSLSSSEVQTAISAAPC